MPRQLPLDLPVRAALGRGDFFVSEANELAVARIDTPESWTGGKLVLVGPEGAGKTHLAHVWAEANGAAILKGARLGEADVQSLSGPVVVEDADTLPESAERWLFHLHNLAASMGLPLLLTARQPPTRWPTALPDLRSRMEASEVVRIGPPDDALLSAMLVKLFSDRQIEVKPALIDWLLPRMERSFAGAQRLVSQLDRAALAAGKPVSRALARELLSIDE